MVPTMTSPSEVAGIFECEACAAHFHRVACLHLYASVRDVALAVLTDPRCRVCNEPGRLVAIGKQ